MQLDPTARTPPVDKARSGACGNLDVTETAYVGVARCFITPVVRWKTLHRRATDSRSGKSERKSLPTWLSDDGDLGNFTAMQKKKIEIIPPICAALPTLKVFKNDEQARFRSHVNPAGEGVLLCGKFGSFQNAADA